MWMLRAELLIVDVCLLCRTVLLMIIFSQLLGRYHIPCFMYSKPAGCQSQPFQLFRMFPVCIICCWIITLGVCGIEIVLFTLHYCLILINLMLMFVTWLHTTVLCKCGWTDRDSAWVSDLWGPKELEGTDGDAESLTFTILLCSLVIVIACVVCVYV